MFTVNDSVGFFLFCRNCLNLNTWGLFLMFTLNWGFFYFKLFSSDGGILIFRCNVLSCNRRQDGRKYLVSIKK